MGASVIVPMKFSLRGSAILASREIARTVDFVIPLATKFALDYAAKRVKTSAKRKIGAALGMQMGLVDSRMVVRKASRKVAKYWSSVGLMKYPIPAARLGARVVERRKGVRAGKHFYKGAFIAKGRQGKEMVFRRQASYTPPIPEDWKPGKDTPKHPIQAMKVPILEKGLPILQATADQESYSYFKREFDRQLAWRLKRAR